MPTLLSGSSLIAVIIVVSQSESHSVWPYFAWEGLQHGDWICLLCSGISSKWSFLLSVRDENTHWRLENELLSVVGRWCSSSSLRVLLAGIHLGESLVECAPNTRGNVAPIHAYVEWYEGGLLGNQRVYNEARCWWSHGQWKWGAQWPTFSWSFSCLLTCAVSAAGHCCAEIIRGKRTRGQNSIVIE